jgi:hypothetical protein
MTRDPVDRGDDRGIGRRDISQMSKQRSFQRESGGAKRRRFSDAREWRTRTGIPDVANVRLSIGKLASRQSKDSRRFARMKSHSCDSRARREIREERFSPWSDYSGRLALKEDKIDASIRQNSVSINELGRPDRLGPKTQHMFAQRYRRQIFAIVGDKLTRL